MELPAEGVGREGEASERVVVALEAYGLGVAYVMDYRDAVVSLGDAEALACEDFLIAASVELGEACAELELGAVDLYGAVSALACRHGLRGEGFGVDAEKIAHAGLLEFEVAGHAVVA